MVSLPKISSTEANLCTFKVMLMFSKIRNKQIHNWPGISVYGSAKFGLLDKARVEGKKPTDARNKCYLFVQ